MKKTRLFKRLTALMGIILVLTFTIWLFTSPISAHAEETEETTETIDPPAEKSVIDTATAFFEDKILPILLSFGGVIVAGLVTLPTVLRGRRKLNRALNAANDEISRLKGVMTTYAGVENKLAEIKTGTEYENLVKSAVNSAIADALKNPLKSISDLSGDTSIINEKLQSLINAAHITWASKPGASKALSTAPTAGALRRREIEVRMLRESLRKKGGADIEKLISEVEEAANNE